MRIQNPSRDNAAVILAGTPPSDGILSMDLYARDISASFDRFFPSLDYVLLQPGGEREPWRRRQALRYFGYPALLRREIGVRKASVVHVLEQSSALLCRVSPKCVVTCHDLAELRVSALTFVQMELWKWRVRALRRAARVIALSRNTANDLTELLNIPPERIVVSHSGLPPAFKPSDSPPQSGCARRLMGLRSNHYLFLHVGSNIRRKNIPVLLRAFSLVRQRYPGGDSCQGRHSIQPG